VDPLAQVHVFVVLHVPAEAFVQALQPSRHLLTPRGPVHVRVVGRDGVLRRGPGVGKVLELLGTEVPQPARPGPRTGRGIVPFDESLGDGVQPVDSVNEEDIVNVK